MSEANQRSGGSLSAPERDALLAMFERLAGSYYELLGVARDCDRAALRGAYFDQLERFGDDRFKGRDVGGFALYVDAITREINAAFAVLGEPDRRARYDRRIALAGELRAVEEPDAPRNTSTPAAATPRSNPKTQPAYTREARSTPTQDRQVPTPAPSISRDARSPMPLSTRHVPSPAPAPAPVPAPTPTPAARGAGAVAPSRRPSQPPPPRQASPAPPPPRKASPATPTPAPAPAPAPATALPQGMALDSLVRLRQENRTREAHRNLEDIETHIEKAARADDFAEVARLLRLAVAMRPDEPTWKSRLVRAEEALQDAEVVRLTAAGRAAEKIQRWDMAGDNWAKIADMRPTDPLYALQAALMICEAAQDFGRAAEYAKRAARLAPEMIAVHVCLTRVYFKAGRTASARSALDAAMKLDPRNPDVIALSQKLRG